MLRRYGGKENWSEMRAWGGDVRFPGQAEQEGLAECPHLLLAPTVFEVSWLGASFAEQVRPLPRARAANTIRAVAGSEPRCAGR